ncbi:hypothetical protein E4U17_003375 [Claviceps sp. LM77 group G4]|nr:hypothetical protein E4U17_003375 [Claviceps sp. LM77 group G4]KAG6069829.1 hypothetical protein E4U16_007328 [Claviceps sp. LM84 group G4]
MDMSSKACSGQHLAGRAPDGDDRNRTEHLSYVIRTCMIHFGRNIDQAVGPTDTCKFAKRMHQLATTRDRDEYLAIIDELIAQTERIKVARWAKHKRQGWVGPGLCQALSNMHPNDWKELRANTNAAEQSGGKSLSFLRDCVLAEGIRTAEVSDRRDMEHLQNRAWTGIAHKQANPSNWNLTYNALRREVNRKRKHAELETSVQENVNQPGRESSSLSEVDPDTLSEEDLERMHPSGAFYPDPYDERNRARRNIAPRAHAGRPSAPRISSPLAGQDRTVRPTAESQSSVQSSPPAGASPSPSQGRDNCNGRSLASRTLEQSQLALNEQMAEMRRLANAAEAQRQAQVAERHRLATEVEVQRQAQLAEEHRLRLQFMTAQAERVRAGQTPMIPYEEVMFQLIDGRT